jgi:DNA polymerase III epsilon subunit-like protein
MLKENFRVHELEVAWLDSTYDLQLIFNRQTDDGTKQRSLEYAMEYFEIPQTLPAHDALNDAYFTALVAAKLDVPLGIKNYNERRGEILLERVIGDADAGDDGYVTINEMLSDDIVKAPTCPICKKPLTREANELHSKGQRYTYLYSCKSDGRMLLSLKLHKNFNDTWRAKLTVELANDEKIDGFQKALERSNIKRKAKRRKPRRKPQAPGNPGSDID